MKFKTLLIRFYNKAIKKIIKIFKYKNRATLIGAITVLGLGMFIMVDLTARSDTATLTLAFEKNKRTFEGPVVEGMTILDAITASAEAGHVKFRYFIDANGKLNIMEVDGYLATVNAGSPVFYSNSRKVDASDIYRVPVKKGDAIEIRLE